MVKIIIKEMDKKTFQVTVAGSSTTVHEVNVEADYAQRITSGKITTIELIQKSFEFLLARESNSSILRRFDLSVIARYFPEYEQEIAKQIN